MQNITKPAKTVSFEDALRNLAAKLTGQPVAALPKTQEAIVQHMADHFPNRSAAMDELAEVVTKEVLARINAAQVALTEDSETAASKTTKTNETKAPGPQQERKENNAQ